MIKHHDEIEIVHSLHESNLSPFWAHYHVSSGMVFELNSQFAYLCKQHCLKEALSGCIWSYRTTEHKVRRYFLFVFSFFLQMYSCFLHYTYNPLFFVVLQLNPATSFMLLLSQSRAKISLDIEKLRIRVLHRSDQEKYILH